MLYNKFLGQSRLFMGSTFLDINPIIKIREGYVTGSGAGVTTEFVSIGEYRVISISNYGYDAQKINLNAKNEFNMMEHEKRVFNHKYSGGYYYYNDFNDKNSINDFSFTSSGVWGITNGCLQRGASFPPPFNYAILNTEQGIENFVIRTKLRASKMSAAEFGAGVAFKAQDNEQESGKFVNTEATWFLTQDALKTIKHHVYIDGVYNSHQPGGVCFAFVDNTWYDIRCEVNNRNIRANYKGPAASAWTQVLDSGYATKYLAGGFGLATYNAYNGTVDFDFLEIIELSGSQKTRADILEDFARERDMTINIPDEVAGFSDFSATYGSSYNVGLTNGYQQMNFVATGKGGSWNVVLTSGSTFNDFVADYEFKGTTGWMGFAIGSATNWYGHYNRMHSPQNSIVLAGGVSVDYLHTTTHGARMDMWNKARIVRNGNYTIQYINGNYASSWLEPTFPNNGKNVQIGFCVHKDGVTNAVYAFRNFRISSLDDVINNAEFSEMGNVANDFDRILPNGYAARYFGETINIIKISGTTNASINELITSSMTENIEGTNKYVYMKGDGVAKILSNTDYRAVKGADNNNYIYTSDDTMKDKTTVDTLAKEQLSIMVSSDNSYGINILPKLLVDKYDGINLVDPAIGVSRTTSVATVTRDMEMETGYFGENLVLNDK